MFAKKIIGNKIFFSSWDEIFTSTHASKYYCKIEYYNTNKKKQGYKTWTAVPIEIFAKTKPQDYSSY